MASDSETVKLLGTKQSPVVLRVRIALNLKEINYEFIEENLGCKSDLLLKSNPVHKKVPVLIHGGHPISESHVILHYIDEYWSTCHHILPSIPYDRAVSRFWASYIDEKWFPSVRGIMLSEGEELNKNIEDASEGTYLMESAFVGISKGKKFFGGEEIGFLDIVLGSFIAMLNVISKMRGVNLIDEIKTPNLFKWAQDFTSDAAVMKDMPETDELMEFTKSVIIPWAKAKTNN